MRASIFAASLLLVGTLAGGLAGCKGNSLDGKWNVSGVEGMPPGSNATYEFKGGQATMALNIKNPQAGEAVIKITGPYKLEGEKLTLIDQKVVIDDSKMTPLGRTFASNPQLKTAMTKGLAENKDYTLKFDSSDQALLTGMQGATVTLMRVK